ncbi:phage tail protein [Gorillibacterium sp. sgz5001074]|uniref:phage tail protein n=1 Tax=Gorillibacterium sp. sgz5001074 TaxID=3446695 RepID=UPI003F66A5E0
MADTYYVYTAVAGDSFDAIALDFYDDETRATILIQANPPYRRVLLFEGGEELQIPILEKTVTAATLPPWKRVSG